MSVCVCLCVLVCVTMCKKVCVFKVSECVRVSVCE